MESIKKVSSCICADHKVRYVVSESVGLVSNPFISIRFFKTDLDALTGEDTENYLEIGKARELATRANGTVKGIYFSPYFDLVNIDEIRFMLQVSPLSKDERIEIIKELELVIQQEIKESER